MSRQFSRLLVAAVSIALTPVATRAEPADIAKTIVFIHCDTKEGKVRGSGVLVSEQGHVLTAGHVVKDATGCQGSIGYANPEGGDPLIMQQQPTNLDAALLRFNKPGPFEYVKYCRLEDWMVRRDIYTAGYPGDTKTGTPSFRKGVLSSVFPNPDGVLETDSQTTAGMSGGPVFASDLKSLIGIVAGAHFDVLGTVGYYGILSTDRFRDQFQLTPSDEPCYHRTHEVALPAQVNSWRPGRPGDPTNDLPLGVHTDQGFCFISGLWGTTSDSRDSVKIEVKQNQYFLTGQNVSGSTYGANVGCVWYQ